MLFRNPLRPAMKLVGGILFRMGNAGANSVGIEMRKVIRGFRFSFERAVRFKRRRRFPAGQLGGTKNSLAFLSIP